MLFLFPSKFNNFLRRWLEEDSPLLGWDHEGTERWMDVLGNRVEKGQTKQNIRKDKGKLPREALENLIFGEYLHWLSWHISCLKTSDEETGTFKEYCQNNGLTKKKALESKMYKRIRSSNKSRREMEKAQMPSLEEVEEEGQEPQTLSQRQTESL